MHINQISIIHAVTVSRSIGFFTPIQNDLRSIGYEVISLSSQGPELDVLKSAGQKTISIPMERRMSPVKDLVSLLRLIKAFKKEKPYIVHSMTPKAGMLCMLAAWLTRVPRRVHTFTGLVWPTATGLTRRILMVTDWITCACATHVIPEGRGVMDDLQTHITKKPMKVLGYGNVRGIDMKRFSLRPEVIESVSNIRKDGVFTFLFVGRIVRDKGINELVNAFQRLNLEFPDTRLLLVGAYEEKLDPIKAESVQIINESSNIELVGVKRDDDLVTYYAASDCFVFPSYREGFPNTVMEAGAMGLPCIVTDINGSREIIIDGKNGVIIPSKDENALYQAMRQMLLDGIKYEEYRNNARSLIERRFEQGYVKRCLLDFYQESLL